VTAQITTYTSIALRDPLLQVPASALMEVELPCLVQTAVSPGR
jgi:hypothetical protein